jgi:hypothetical protein
MVHVCFIRVLGGKIVARFVLDKEMISVLALLTFGALFAVNLTELQRLVELVRVVATSPYSVRRMKGTHSTLPFS